MQKNIESQNFQNPIEQPTYFEKFFNTLQTTIKTSLFLILLSSTKINAKDNSVSFKKNVSTYHTQNIKQNIYNNVEKNNTQKETINHLLEQCSNEKAEIRLTAVQELILFLNNEKNIKNSNSIKIKLFQSNYKNIQYALLKDEDAPTEILKFSKEIPARIDSFIVRNKNTATKELIKFLNYYNDPDIGIIILKNVLNRKNINFQEKETKEIIYEIVKCAYEDQTNFLLMLDLLKTYKLSYEILHIIYTFSTTHTQLEDLFKIITNENYTIDRNNIELQKKILKKYYKILNNKYSKTNLQQILQHSNNLQPEIVILIKKLDRKIPYITNNVKGLIQNENIPLQLLTLIAKNEYELETNKVYKANQSPEEYINDKNDNIIITALQSKNISYDTQKKELAKHYNKSDKIVELLIKSKYTSPQILDILTEIVNNNDLIKIGHHTNATESIKAYVEKITGEKIKETSNKIDTTEDKKIKTPQHITTIKKAKLLDEKESSENETPLALLYTIFSLIITGLAISLRRSHKNLRNLEIKIKEDEELRIEAEKKVRKLETEIKENKDLEYKIENLENKKKDLENQIENLKNDKEDLQNQIENLKNDKEDLQNQIENLKNDKEDLQSKIRELEDQVFLNETTIKNLRTDLINRQNKHLAKIMSGAIITDITTAIQNAQEILNEASILTNKAASGGEIFGKYYTMQVIEIKNIMTTLETTLGWMEETYSEENPEVIQELIEQYKISKEHYNNFRYREAYESILRLDEKLKILLENTNEEDIDNENSISVWYQYISQNLIPSTWYTNNHEHDTFNLYNFFEILNIENITNINEINEDFRKVIKIKTKKLLKKFHPDKAPQNNQELRKLYESNFNVINVIKNLFKDQRKTKQYINAFNKFNELFFFTKDYGQLHDIPEEQKEKEFSI